jgi:type I restriction enzyme S subunit
MADTLSKVRLLDVCEFISGNAHEQHISPLGEFTVINSKFVSTEGKVAKFASENFCPAKKNDITLVMSDLPNGKALGKCFLVPENNKYAVNQRVCILRSKGFDPKYLFYILNRNPYFLSFNDGVSQTHLLNSVFEKCYISVTEDIKEQKTIAKALSDIDELIVILQIEENKHRSIKSGLLYQIEKTFAETTLLKNCVSTPVTDGPHLTPQFYSSGVPFLSVNNIVDNNIVWENLRYISHSDDLEFSKKCKPRKFDILLGKAASVGKIAIVDRDIDFNVWSPLAVIRMNQDFDPYFIYFCFQTKTVMDQILFLTNSSSQGNIGMGDIENINLPVLDKSEQIRLGNLLRDEDNHIEGISKLRSKYESVKQGMTQDLLTGKVRLV